MIRLGIVLVLLLAITGAAAQTELDTLVQRATIAYEAGDYATAVSMYEALLDAGVQNAALYFNLGNAYLQKDDAGHALLYYLRAQELSPRDSDLDSNIARARTIRVDVFNDEITFWVSLANATKGFVTILELSWLTFLLWIAYFGSIVFSGAFAGLRDVWRYVRSSILFLFVMSAVLLGSRLLLHIAEPAAVVVHEAVPVMSGPGETYLDYYDLHSGAELRILETRTGWVRFILPDGQQGWLPEDAIVRVSSF